MSMIAGSSVSPSTPQLRLMLSLWPSLVVLAVRLVVLLLVAHEVAQRVAVVRGDEVDARVHAAVAPLEDVARAGEARSPAPATCPGSPRPELAHGVAILAVPLRPAHREVAHLVAARAHVPRLGDQLHVGQRRVLLHDVEERRELVHLVQLAREHGREVEAEAVDVHLGHPVAQRVHHELDRARVLHVERVARAGEVGVEARVVRLEPIVRRVVDALERQRRPEMVPLAGVVVDHVEDHLDAGGCSVFTMVLNS